MRQIWKPLGTSLCMALLLTVVLTLLTFPALAAGAVDSADPVDTAASAQNVGDKALAAAIVVGLAAAAGAIGMGMAIGKSADGISRQPEAEGKIRTTLMLGLVFIETVVIFALIVAILIIFVL